MKHLKKLASPQLTKSKCHRHVVLLLRTSTNVNKMASTLLKSSQSQIRPKGQFLFTVNSYMSFFLRFPIVWK